MVLYCSSLNTIISFLGTHEKIFQNIFNDHLKKKMIETQSYILFYVNGKRILGMLLNNLFSLKVYPMVVRIKYSKS